MRLGIIGYANNSGLGVMTQDLIRIFKIENHLIIPGGEKGTNLELSTALNKIASTSWLPPESLLRDFLLTIDIIITIETTYHPGLFQICREMGVRSVFLSMWEWFEWSKYKDADVYIATSIMCCDYLLSTLNVESKDVINDHIDKIKYLPWALDTAKFEYKERCGNRDITTFVHNAGFGGMNYRKGSIEVIEAFKRFDGCKIRLLLRTQKPIEQYPFYDYVKSDKRIHVFSGELESNKELYDEGDIFLYLARYDGQALVVEEAMACGFPVFVTDARPMNEFSDDHRFMIRVSEYRKLKIHNHFIDMNITDVDDLVNRMKWSTYEELHDVSLDNRNCICDNYSWDMLKSRYTTLIYGQ